MIESREERFKRIAAKRTNAIIKKIRLLGNCSNKNSYEYKEEEVKAIFTAIERRLRFAKKRFADGERKKFTLK